MVLIITVTDQSLNNGKVIFDCELINYSVGLSEFIIPVELPATNLSDVFNLICRYWMDLSIKGIPGYCILNTVCYLINLYINILYLLFHATKILIFVKFPNFFRKGIVESSLITY